MEPHSPFRRRDSAASLVALVVTALCLGLIALVSLPRIASQGSGATLAAKTAVPGNTAHAASLAPLSPTASAGTGGVLVQWPRQPSVNGYIVERSGASSGPWTPVATPSPASVTTWTDSPGPAAGTTSFYGVAALAGSGWSGPSGGVASAAGYTDPDPGTQCATVTVGTSGSSTIVTATGSLTGTVNILVAFRDGSGWYATTTSTGDVSAGKTVASYTLTAMTSLRTSHPTGVRVAVGINATTTPTATKVESTCTTATLYAGSGG